MEGFNLLDLDQDELKRYLKKVKQPLLESIDKARTIIHLQDLVAGGKKNWTQLIMPQLLTATHHTESLTKRTIEQGDAFPSFDRWIKDNRGKQRMFPAALIFIASAAKKKLQAFLEVQKGLQAAIEDHQDQMNYCIQEIQREKNCGLLQQLLQPVRLLLLKDIEDVVLEDESTWEYENVVIERNSDTETDLEETKIETIIENDEIEVDNEDRDKEGILENEENKENEKTDKIEEEIEKKDTDNELDIDNDAASMDASMDASIHSTPSEDVSFLSSNTNTSSQKEEQSNIERKELHDQALLKRQQLRLEIKKEILEEQINQQEEERRRALQYYGTRKSDFLHGYPVVLEAAVLLDALLVHYSRAGT